MSEKKLKNESQKMNAIETETFKKNGKTYYSKPNVEVRVNGFRRIFDTFEWCCEHMELSTVTETHIFPEYFADGDYVSYSTPYVVLLRSRVSCAKDSRWFWF